ncbi:MAG: hypothetical protein ACFB03_06940 [Paracoccaceae bacterium]
MAIPAPILERDDVFHTVPPMKMDDAFARVNQLERRDAAALAGLQGDEFELQFYQDDATKMNRYEWGVVREANGINPDCILVSGGPGGVAFGPFLEAGLIPLAHSHPYHTATAASTRAIAGGAVAWNNINGTEPAQNMIERLKIFPSAGDAYFCSQNDLATHRVETPYVVVFNPANIRYIANPDAHPAFAAAPRLTFQINNARALPTAAPHTRIDLTAYAGTVAFWVKHDIDVSGHGGAGIVL